MSAKNPKCPICHKKAIEQGTKDFADVEDVTKYVEDLRGRGENL